MWVLRTQRVLTTRMVGKNMPENGCVMVPLDRMYCWQKINLHTQYQGRQGDNTNSFRHYLTFKGDSFEAAQYVS